MSSKKHHANRYGSKNKKRTGAKSSLQTAGKKKNKKARPIHSITADSMLTEPISFGLLQHEIDEIIGAHRQPETNAHLESSIMKELARLLPEKEAITKKTADNHTSILVQSIARRAEHSPFVLDLTELIEKKHQSRENKHRILSLFRELRPRHHEVLALASTALEEEEKQSNKPAREERIIIAEHEEPINLDRSPLIRVSPERLHKQFTRQPLFYHFNLPFHWHRTFIAYAAICLIIVMPIKVFGHYQEIKKSQSQIVSFATTAYQDLKIASQELATDQTEQAETRFNEAKQNFFEANQELNSLSLSIKAILKILPVDGANLADAEYLLDVGERVAKIGGTLSSVLDSFKTTSGKLTDRVAVIQSGLEQIVPEIAEVNNNLQKIRSAAIPPAQKAQFNYIKNYLATLNNDLDELSRFSRALNQILGADHKRRYLFVFQNNNEIRPTGGFMGSFALVDIDRGEIKNIEIPGGGTYDLQGSLLAKMVSPYPLHLVNPLWEMQDANWFPDFPTSAEKITWFYENSGGPTVDGVIAINASLIPSLLEIVGPINMPGYGKVFMAGNFINELQKSIELEYKNKQENKPKIILSDLAPKLLDKIFSAKGDQLLQIAQTLKSGLDQKDILFYFTNSAIQEKVSSYGWTGELLDTSKDYFSLVNANIGGGKTDNFIDQKIDIVSDFYETGEIVNTVTVTRKHTGTLLDPFGKTSNLVFARFYTPVGSQLLSAQGFCDKILPESFEAPAAEWGTDELLQKVQGEVWVEPGTGTYINNEFNKTVFGNWIQTDPGEETTVILKYKLPFKSGAGESSRLKVFSGDKKTNFHSLFIQKQAGQQNTTYAATINLPKNLQPTWIYPNELKNSSPRLAFSADLREDQLLAFILE